MTRPKPKRAWLREHLDDIFVKRAQKEGYRSRAVYKLMEIDERDRLFRAGQTVVDLGAAPGGWSQYARKRVGTRGRVVALDVLPIAPLPGVDVIQGDFTEQAVLGSLLDRLGGKAVDLVISDMAPNMSGITVSDQPRSIYLAELALDFAAEVLRPGGGFLVKAFQGEGFRPFHQQMQSRFEKLVSRKPRASRPRSREIYLLGRGFIGA